MTLLPYAGSMRAMLRRMIIGVATYLPGVRRYDLSATGTDNARYCYSVWLRHLVLARQNGLPTDPRVVAELGPGDSLGIGLAALLSGAEQYYAFDITKYATADRNLAIFDQLCEMLRSRSVIPGSDEFPETKPPLTSYSFPSGILTDERLERALEPSRVARLRDSLQSMDRDDSAVQYIVPWDRREMMKLATVDLVLSQAVLEHVDDLPATYRSIHEWLAPGGFMSHQIDFRSHGFADTWNGHWEYSDLTWRLIRGNRSYLINREPASTHLRLVQECGFEVSTIVRATSDPGATPQKLAPRFRGMTREDLETSGMFVQARKVGGE